MAGTLLAQTNIGYLSLKVDDTSSSFSIITKMKDWKEGSHYQHCLDVVARYTIVMMEYLGKTFADIMPESKLPLSSRIIARALMSIMLIEADIDAEESLSTIDNNCVLYIDLARVVDDRTYQDIAKIYGELDSTELERSKGLEQFANTQSQRWNTFYKKYKGKEILDDDARLVVALDVIIKERKCGDKEH